MSETENKNADETLNIIENFFDYIKNAQKDFQLASKVDKGKSELKFEKSIAGRVKLKSEKIAEIKKEEKNIKNNLLKNYFSNYESPSDMYKKLHDTKGKKNEERVQAIKKMLYKMKKRIERLSEDKKSIIEENEKMIKIVERILYFNQLEQLKNTNTKPNAW